MRICVGRRPRMWKLYSKIHKISKAIAHFCTNKWNFSDNNVQMLWNNLNKEDQQIYPFNIRELDWAKYLIDYHKGIRLYLLKEDDSTLEISRINYNRLYWTHQIFKTVLIFAILWLIWNIFIKIFA
ncbi:fatty acyl-CoA reductase 2-like [Nylanderia fulva]|uniref:fatty acyl-CoA reductase 2-like n=1 Tax=Nylanderia fulva TaxID=613905 RepID=UPI0010FBA3AA|nr:fatty acyl-CoA reductase 2-like [Nylanderia fulva]